MVSGGGHVRGRTCSQHWVSKNTATDCCLHSHWTCVTLIFDYFCPYLTITIGVRPNYLTNFPPNNNGHILRDISQSTWMLTNEKGCWSFLLFFIAPRWWLKSLQYLLLVGSPCIAGWIPINCWWNYLNSHEFPSSPFMVPNTTADLLSFMFFFGLTMDMRLVPQWVPVRLFSQMLRWRPLPVISQ